VLDQILMAFDGTALAVWGPFGLLILCGIGLPIPEDIILVAAGFLAAENGKPYVSTAFIMYVGILLGDSVIYCVGRLFGRKVLRTRLGKLLVNAERLGKVEELFGKYGAGVLFVGRFLPGLRAPIYLTAGTIRYSFLRFLTLDGLAALISAPLFVWLGHWAWERFADDLDLLQKTVGRTKLYMMGGVVALALVIFYLLHMRSRSKRAT
jgi:membrane protein DedA with SNARE-associated domain